MGSGKLNMVVFLMVMGVAALQLHTSTAQTTHVVLGPSGWTIPEIGAVAYTAWASNKTFTVGDTLVFNFYTTVHTVAEVTKAAFDGCTTSGPLSLWNRPPARVTLNSSGEHYYLCTITGHCYAGQKLAINVTAAASTPPPSSQSPAGVTAPPPPNYGRSEGNKVIWIIIAVAIFLVLLILASLWYLRMRKIRLQGEEKKRRDEYLQELIHSNSFKNTNEIGSDRREGHDLNIFSFASILAATNDFSNENKLGQGGFGPVYKGKLVDGREIAIKRLAKTSAQGLVEFKNELILIAKLQHTNLVRVLGCCIHGDEKMLIYEYMSNKSLDHFLFDENRRVLLDWQKRFNIIEGVGQGLLYLHKYSRMRVIHRDLKASNILLDENMNPKISDFGMARIFRQNETEAMTIRVVGTYGYMSPEYAMEGTFSMKSDVFSFGVLVLEIVSGRRNNSFYNPDRPLNLIGYTWELWKEGNVFELKDPTLEQKCTDVKQLSRTVHIGLLCVQENAMDRPNMSDVLSMLSNETIPLPAPKRPAFFTGRSVLDPSSSESRSKEFSVNDISITVMEAR